MMDRYFPPSLIQSSLRNTEGSEAIPGKRHLASAGLLRLLKGALNDGFEGVWRLKKRIPILFFEHNFFLKLTPMYFCTDKGERL